jgi:periplasmic protein TonB
MQVKRNLYTPSMQDWPRFAAIATGVAALHLAALWVAQSYRAPTRSIDNTAALSTRLLPPPVEPLSAIARPALKTPTPSSPQSIAAPQTPRPSTTTAPAPPLSIAPANSTAPAAFVTHPHVAAPPALTESAALTAPVPTLGSVNALTSTAPTTPATALAKISTNTQLPTTDADHADTQYRHPLPAISTRLGEHGKVMVRVWVGADGKAQQVQLLKSSGYPRLDDNALATVMRWKFKAGTHNGTPVAMAMEQPVIYAAP